MEVDDDCVHNLCLGLEVTLVQEPSVKVLFELNATRELISNKKYDGP